MKQKLLAIALAGLSGTAFAQSTVTITGLFDTGVQMFKSESLGVTTKTNRWGSSSNTGTTNFTFLVQEDLGNNMKAGLFLETDPTAGTANVAGVWNSQNYLWVSGGFGKVSLGLMNNFANTAAGTAQPFGTAMGGGYSSAFGRLNGANVSSGPITNVAASTAATAGAFAGARDIRANNSIKWDSPSFSGFTAGLLYRSPNSNGNAAADSDGQTQVGLNYNNGPMNVSYAHSNILSNVAGINTGVTTHNLLGANYKFGAVTLYGGWTSSKNTGVAARTVDARSWNVALKWQATPALSVAANVLRSDDKMAADQDRDLNSLGLDYAMSKRTTAYVRWEGGDNDKSAVTGANGGKFNRTAFGLKHTF
ncbi:MAG: porin [Sulfuritalea sp.]|nr:porin [Sulfuritalea sp.]